MIYRLAFEGVHAPTDELINAEIQGGLIPGIGEHVRIMGREYVVLDVVHEITYSLPGDAIHPTVVLGQS